MEPNFKKMFEKLEKEFNQYKAESVKWSWEDFQGRAQDRGIKLSKKKCQELLEQMIRKHDASIGINWDVLDCYIDNFC